MNDNNNKKPTQSGIHNPSDKLFKNCMADKRVAKDLLRMCLPKEILDTINFNYLKLSPQSYITRNYQDRHLDVLYETKIKGKDGFIYILTEHQSQPDPMMPLRIKEYINCIIRHYLKQNNITEPFPVVYPLVFYTGDHPYPYSTDFFDRFGEQKRLRSQF